MRKLLVALLMLPALARAEFWTGNDLFNRMSSTDVIERVQAVGYVMGAYDVGVNLFFCPATQTGITAGQLRDMMFNWLSVNAHRRNESAEKLINEVFARNWPCRNRGSGGGTRL